MILTFVSISISFVELNLNFSIDTQNDNIHFDIAVITFERSHVKQFLGSLSSFIAQNFINFLEQWIIPLPRFISVIKAYCKLSIQRIIFHRTHLIHHDLSPPNFWIDSPYFTIRSSRCLSESPLFDVQNRKI